MTVYLINDEVVILRFTSDIKEIVEQVVDDLLEEIGNSIDKNVYAKGTPEVYIRLGDNGGIRGSFTSDQVKIVRNVVTNRLFHDPESMENDPLNFIHGSFYWRDPDFRPYLAQTIIEGTSGDLFGDGFWRVARDFWQPFIELIKSGFIDRAFEKYFRMMGFTYRKTR